MALAPAPNGAKEFYIPRRASKPDASLKQRRAGLSSPKETYSLFRKGGLNTVLSSEESAFDPSAKGRWADVWLETILSDRSFRFM